MDPKTQEESPCNLSVSDFRNPGVKLSCLRFYKGRLISLSADMPRGLRPARTWSILGRYSFPSFLLQCDRVVMECALRMCLLSCCISSCLNRQSLTSSYSPLSHGSFDDFDQLQVSTQLILWKVALQISRFVTFYYILLESHIIAYTNKLKNRCKIWLSTAKSIRLCHKTTQTQNSTLTIRTMYSCQEDHV